MGVVVGIPPSLDTGRLRPGRRTHYLDAAYARAIAEAGGIPVYLPPEASAADAIAAIDGLLVPGGGDFLPDGPHPGIAELAPVAEEQLASDRALLDAALARGVPVLGICYGMQLLALRGGGRLLVHLPHDFPAGGEHRLADPDARHALSIAPGSRLACALGTTHARVNSRHHQGIAAAGAGLLVTARAEDGLVEAVEADGANFVLGVQWHPESMQAEHRARIFGAFVAACRERAAGGSR